MIHSEPTVGSIVLPGYLKTDSHPYSSNWNLDLVRASMQGLTGGGVLLVSNKQADSQLFLEKVWRHSEIENRFGRDMLGNEAGKQIKRQIASLEPLRIPRVAIKFGADHFKGRRPQVRVTCESSSLAGNESYLMLLPRRTKGNSKCSNVLSNYLDFFGLGVTPVTDEIRHNLTPELPWLKTIRANQSWYKIKHEETINIQLIMAFVIYSLECIDSLTERIAVAHFVADIEGNPRIREFWTSPPK